MTGVYLVFLFSLSSDLRGRKLVPWKAWRMKTGVWHCVIEAKAAGLSISIWGNRTKFPFGNEINSLSKLNWVVVEDSLRYGLPRQSSAWVPVSLHIASAILCVLPKAFMLQMKRNRIGNDAQPWKYISEDEISLSLCG